MKNIPILHLILLLCFSQSISAEYKIIFTDSKIPLSAGPVIEEIYEPPFGEPDIYPNEVTVSCLGMPDQEEFIVNEKTYKVFYSAAQAKANPSIACTSNITNMDSLFRDATSFNQDISHWDTSNVTDMDFMFYQAQGFNKDISNWDTSKVISMRYMFYNADAFNQNLTGWCVDNFTAQPDRFGYAANIFSRDNHPEWGICPQNATTEGASIAANGITVQCEGMEDGKTIEVNGELYRVTNTNGAAISVTKEGVKVCTSNLTNMASMFKHVPNSSPLIGDPNFNQDLSHWDTSNVTTMDSMFREVTGFNQNLSGWDTSKVTDMDFMFYQAQGFNQNIGAWDTSNVISMRYMFYNADAFNQNLTGWCVDNFTTESERFGYAANSFSVANHPEWGICPQEAITEGVSIAANGVTVQCEGISDGKTIDVNGGLYRVTNTNADAISVTKEGVKVCTSNLTNMASMFKHVPNSSPLIGDPNFNQDLSHWDTSNVTTMDSMFREVTGFNQNIGYWDTSKVTDMDFMFYQAQGFNQNIGAWDTSNVISMRYMFYNADAFNRDLTGWCVDNFTAEPERFGYAANLFSVTNHPEWGICPQEATTQGASLAANGVTVQCPGVANGTTISVNGNLYRVTNNSADAASVTKEGVKVCTSNLTNMASLFKHVPNSSPLIGDPNFNQDLSHWDTSNVTTMDSMFREVHAFNQDLGAWDTSNVVDMDYMFYQARAFNKNIGSWDTSSATGMRYMFYNADVFNQDLTNWCVENFTVPPERFVYSANNFLSAYEPLWGQACN